MDYEKLFIVATYASCKAFGVVLSYLDKDGRYNLIHYASCTLNDAENNYSTYEREALEILPVISEVYLVCRTCIQHSIHARTYCEIGEHLRPIGLSY